MIATNVSVIELLWTLGGIVGLLSCAYNFREAILDLRALLGSGRNGAMLELARTSGKGETARMFGHSLVVAIGSTAMTQPNPLGPWPVSAVGWFLSMSLFATVGVLLYESVLSARSRGRVRAEVENRES